MKPYNKPCRTCGTTAYMAFECITCCLKWLRQMSPEERTCNARVIGRVAGEDHLNAVRQAWKG